MPISGGVLLCIVYSGMTTSPYEGEGGVFVVAIYLWLKAQRIFLSGLRWPPYTVGARTKMSALSCIFLMIMSLVGPSFDVCSPVCIVFMYFVHIIPSEYCYAPDIDVLFSLSALPYDFIMVAQRVGIRTRASSSAATPTTRTCCS